MHLHPRFVCTITAVVLAACTCFGLLAIYNHAHSRSNQTIFILNIVAISILLMLIVFIILFHTFRTIRGYYSANPQNASPGSAVLEISQFSAKSNDTFPSADICSICLGGLSTGGARKMNCCANHLHESCIVSYCSAHISSNLTAPLCPLCRNTLPVTWTRSQV